MSVTILSAAVELLGIFYNWFIDNEPIKYQQFLQNKETMTGYHYILGVYLLTVNIISFVLYGMDKYKAKRGKWRISEATLLTMAVIGGSIGAWMGMNRWNSERRRHACMDYPES